MGEEFVRKINEKIRRHSFISVDDVYKLLSIIDILEKENKHKSKYIKELEELNKSTTKSYFIYADGDVIINANNDND
jgi:hypothetical protein